MSTTTKANIHALKQLLVELRSEANACPWTLRQDFQSLAPQTVEEAYELADAIARNDLKEIKSELGDLLYHLFFYFQLADEQQLFDLSEVIQSVIDKHEKRMPSSQERKNLSPEQANDYWQRAKLKQQETQGILSNIAKNLPALSYADKIQSRAARVGFDWQEIAPVFDKLTEEIAEVKAEIAQAQGQNTQALQMEVGDLLFTCTNLARKLNINPEEALQQSNRKFSQRIGEMEKQAKTQGKSLSELSAEELEQLWAAAKIISTQLPDLGST